MKGTLRKGREAQSLARGVLVNLGYPHVEEARPQRMRLPNGAWRTLNEDIHGVFDLEGLGPAGVRLVQVTDGASVKERCDKITANGPWPVDQGFCLVEVWDLQRRRNVVNPRLTDRFFRVTRLLPDGSWRAIEALEVEG